MPYAIRKHHPQAINKALFNRLACPFLYHLRFIFGHQFFRKVLLLLALGHIVLPTGEQNELTDSLFFPVTDQKIIFAKSGAYLEKTKPTSIIA